MVAVHGEVHPRFDRVRKAFEDNFERRGELGASVCLWYQGEKVVDLWAGVADKATGARWDADTLAVLFSATKGLAATAMLMLADRGAVDLDAPVSRYWPGFGAAGKQSITVRTLLNHRAGVCALDRTIGLDDLEDPPRLLPALEEQVPLWDPGTDQGYHGISFGLYVAELFRRVAGRSLGAFLAEEVAAPLGADVHLGLTDRAATRVATLYPVGRRDRVLRIVPRALVGRGVEGRVYRAYLSRTSDTHRAFANPEALGPKGIANFNSPRVQAMELPWANGIGSARGLAKVYAALAGVVDGAPLVSSEALAGPQQRQTWQVDRVLRKTMGFSQGFVKEEPHLFSPFPEAFGHPGAGGALGMTDPPRGFALGYVMNRMDWRLRSPRALALCHAVYDCV